MSEFEILLNNNSNIERLSGNIHKLFLQAQKDKKLRKIKYDFLETDQGDLYSMLIEGKTLEIINALDFLNALDISPNWVFKLRSEVTKCQK